MKIYRAEADLPTIQKQSIKEEQSPSSNQKQKYRELKESLLPNRSVILAGSSPISDSIEHLLKSSNNDEKPEKLFEIIRQTLHDKQLNGKCIVSIMLEEEISLLVTKKNWEFYTNGTVESYLGQDKVYEFAKFKFDENSNIIVSHFSKHNTKGFSEDLLVQQKESAISSKEAVSFHNPLGKKYENIRIQIEGDVSELLEYLLDNDQHRSQKIQTDSIKFHSLDLLDSSWDIDSYRTIENIQKLVEEGCFEYLQECIENNLVNQDGQRKLSDQDQSVTIAEEGIRENGHILVERQKPYSNDVFYTVINPSAFAVTKKVVSKFEDAITSNSESIIINLVGEPKEKPLKVGSSIFLNESSESLDSTEVSYLEELLEDMKTSNSKAHKDLVRILFLEYLGQKVKSAELQDMLRSIKGQTTKNNDINGYISDTESDIIEYKKGDKITNNSGDELITTLVEAAISQTPTKESVGLIVWGVYEDDREIDPINKSLDDDTQNEIENEIDSEFPNDQIRFNRYGVKGGYCYVLTRVETGNSNLAKEGITGLFD